MADVKIIDIDNEQWNMKDQEARNRTANLENNLPTKLENIFMGDYDKNGFVIPDDGNFITATKTGFLTGVLVKTPNNSSSVSIAEENIFIFSTDMVTATSYWNGFTVLIRKGKRYRLVKNEDNGAHFDYLQFLPFNFD